MSSKTEKASADIKALIENGTFANGSRMPPERELAKTLGLSQGTVTKAVAMLASEGLVRKVHGSGNFVASSRAPRRGLDICFLSEKSGDERVNPVWHLIFESFYEASADSGLNMALKFLPRDGGRNFMGEIAEARMVVAAISLHPEKAQLLVDAGKPVLWLDEPARPLPGPALYMDNFEAGRLVGAHFIEQGCSNLLYITHHFSPLYPPSDRRFDGFLAGARESGRAPAVSTWPCFNGAADFKSLLEKRLEGIDGVFCFCDSLASLVMKVAASFGRRPPVDFALAGVDDLPLSELLSVSMTTVRHPFKKIGRLAFDMVSRMLDGERLEGALSVKPELVARESSLRGRPVSKAM